MPPRETQQWMAFGAPRHPLLNQICSQSVCQKMDKFSRSCALHDFHVPESDLAWHARQQWGGEQKQPGPTDQHDFGNWRWSVGLSLSYYSIPFSILQSSIYPDHLPSRTSGGFQYEQSNANRSSCMSGQRLAIAQIASKYFGAFWGNRWFHWSMVQHGVHNLHFSNDTKS